MAPVSSTVSASSLSSARAVAVPSGSATAKASPVCATKAPSRVNGMRFSLRIASQEVTARETTTAGVAVKTSVYADRNQIVLDGVGDSRFAAVGQRKRRAIGAEHREQIDAPRRIRQRRKQLFRRVVVELLDIRNF